MEIVKAIPDDHIALTKLTKASKAYWGFDPQILEKWSDELTITSTYVETHFVFKLVISKIVIGYYSYFEKENSTVKLDNLFIAPEYIRKGYGTILMNDFMRKAEERYATITLDAEPNAVEFYEHYGFKIIGQLPSKIKGRFLPIMIKNTKKAEV